MGDLIEWRELSTSLFCQRKLYYESVEHVAVESKYALRHKILTEALRYTNKAEAGILKSIKEVTLRHKISQLYDESNGRCLQEAILNNKEALTNNGLSIIELSQSLKKELAVLTSARIDNVTEFITKHKRFGTDLWWALRPKMSFDLKTDAPKLGITVIVDRVDNYDDGVVLYLYSKHEPPKEGLWPGDSLLLATAMLAFAEQGLIIKEGCFVYYNTRRSLKLTPDLTEQVHQAIARIRAIKESSQRPSRVDNKNKCDACILKEHCYNDPD